MTLLSLLLVLSLATNIAVVSAQAYAYQTPSQLQARVLDACKFLKTLYNPTLSLVRETPGSQTYHIASDNLLAQKALESCDPQPAASTRATIATCCGDGYSMMHESLLEVESPLPVRTATTYTIANSSAGLLFNGVQPSLAGGNYTVLWEVHNGTGTLSIREYADVAAYTALEYIRRGNRTGTSLMLENLNLMFDGQGLVDEPYQNGTRSEQGIYQTYKLALYIHILSKQAIPVPPGLLERLLRMQNPEGGFHTGYDHNGTYAGTLANAETASIVIIVLSQLSPKLDPCPLFLLCPQKLLGWIVLYSLIAVVAGIAITALFVYRNRKRRELKRST